MKGLNKYDRPNWRFIYFDGDAYVIVDKSVEKELFSHDNYGLNPTSLLSENEEMI